MWREIVEKIAKNNEYVKIQPPATQEDTERLNSKYGEIPQELKDLLLELNGDNDCLFSVEWIIEMNELLRNDQYNDGGFMSFKSLLFFAGNGCGDYYGYAISKNGIEPRRIFMWCHETDDRIEVAGSLKEAIALMYESMSDEILGRKGCGLD